MNHVYTKEQQKQNCGTYINIRQNRFQRKEYNQR